MKTKLLFSRWGVIKDPIVKRSMTHHGHAHLSYQSSGRSHLHRDKLLII